MYIIALDQGTTSSRAVVFDAQGKPVASAERELRQIYPRSGWVEHDPEEIYATLVGAMAEAVALAGIDGKEIAAIGIANQRETAIVWDKKTGKPVCNAIVWQCRRTAEQCEALLTQGYGGLIKRRTGLLPDAYFSATKIRWILDNVAGARERAEAGELAFGTVDSWLIWKLTGRHVTDRTNASRTMLYSLRELSWDGELCALFGIPLSMLPEVVPSSGVLGYTDIGGAKVPIASAVGDQQAALYGQRCFSRGECKCTYGTGCFLLMHAGAEPPEPAGGLLATVAASTGGAAYALEGSVFIAGALIQWLRDGLGIIKDAADVGPLAQSVPDSAGAVIVPAFTGLGAPYWDMRARGAVFGLTRGVTAALLARAAEEAIACQAADLLTALTSSSGARVRSLCADGGAAADDFLMSVQANVLGIPVLRPSVGETTALGAAYLAGLAVGLWADEQELQSLDQSRAVFSPTAPREERAALLARWHAAVACCRKYKGQ